MCTLLLIISSANGYGLAKKPPQYPASQSQMYKNWLRVYNKSTITFDIKCHDMFSCFYSPKAEEMDILHRTIASCINVEGWIYNNNNTFIHHTGRKRNYSKIQNTHKTDKL